MASVQEKDTFDSFQEKYRTYRAQFNTKLGLNVQDEIAKFYMNSYSGRTLAAVVLMLVHNQYKSNAKKLPTLQNIQSYDLAKLETIPVKMFAPYIDVLREGKKEKKASGGAVAAEIRKAKFNATFFIYLEIVKKIGITTIKDDN